MIQSKLRILGVVALVVTQISCVTNSHRGKPWGDQQESPSIHFEAKWWSNEQIDGLIIDDAPAQETTVILEMWDPSDPVSTPHPDLLEVIAEFDASFYSSKFKAVSEIRWLVGPLDLEQLATWTDWKPLRENISIELSKDNQRTFSFGQIDLKNNLEKWYKLDRWAHALDVRISMIGDLTIATSFNSISKKLPIMTAD